MTLHPLLNPDSAHYQDGKKVAIEEMERELSVREMIGYCKGNIFKYAFRKELKGALEADEKKIATYEAYLKLLKDLASLSLENHKVSDALRMTKRVYAYRVEELVDATTLF